MSRIVIIFNDTAGANQRKRPTSRQLLDLFNKYKSPATLLKVNANNFDVQLKKALQEHPSIIVAAGGDGTISTVASYLIGKNISLGVLPYGTLNHFAKDLNLPEEIEDCVKIIAQGQKYQVDVAEVNGHYFINNSSIGIYPLLVAKRDQQIKSSKRNKWLALLISSLQILFKFPVLKLEVHIKNKPQAIKTPLLFIGNNKYHLDVTFSRKSLSSGELGVYILKYTHRFVLLKLFWQACQRGFYKTDDLESHSVKSLVINSASKKIKVARDGEVCHLDSPLLYAIHEKALWVYGKRLN